ncbi:hypothetical protein NicSoilB11_22780 [Arthrobacter sp. NicSoilB11]|nr:hypothetical protein StoSoilB19_22420 [Arthrobacter sp. StoSoilB19]BCW75953.1 hypothetical protein NicSoilB11_22780 [Arthrobacter sp. NicSoilB11]
MLTDYFIQGVTVAAASSWSPSVFPKLKFIAGFLSCFVAGNPQWPKAKDANVTTKPD